MKFQICGTQRSSIHQQMLLANKQILQTISAMENNENEKAITQPQNQVLTHNFLQNHYFLFYCYVTDTHWDLNSQAYPPPYSYGKRMSHLSQSSLGYLQNNHFQINFFHLPNYLSFLVTYSFLQ